VDQLNTESKDSIDRGTGMKTVKHDYDQAFIDGLLEILERNKDDGLLDTQPDVPKVNIKEVRESLGISQPEFAHIFGIPLATLRNWEQGRSEPHSMGSSFLYLIEKCPNVIIPELLKLPRK